MKLLHTTMLNTREFNELSDNIIDKFYDINPDIRELYDIHINYIEDSWVIDFLPIVDNIPAIKTDAYTETDDNGREILKVTPANLTDFPETLKLKDSGESYDLCMNYVVVFEFVLSLFDFEYRLS